MKTPGTPPPLREDFFPCPCCGARVLDEEGGYEICPICDWEDDPSQRQHPDLAGSANPASLLQAQNSWRKLGRINPEERV